MDVCQMLKDKLEETKKIFVISNNFFAENKFVPARSAQGSCKFLISYLGKQVEEFIPPPEIVKVELEINPPHVDKKIALAYTGTNKLQCQAYNAAITEVMKKAGMPVSISTGHTENIGYKAFEALNNLNLLTLKKLIPAIHEEARKVYKLLYKMKSYKI